MGRKPKSRPSFFKIMLKDFTRHLQLPPSFVQKYGKFLPESIKLRTGASGETWNVELEQVDEETYYFSRGWTKFALDVGLKMGEFLVFWFNLGKSTFDMSVYGISGCERQISGCDSLVDSPDSDKDVQLIEYCTPVSINNGRVKTEVKNNRSRTYAVRKEAETDDTQENDNISEEARPQLKLCLKEHQRSRWSVCKEFAVAAGLTSEKAAVLQYPPKQRCWPVILVHYQNFSQFRLDMAGGWSQFRRANGLVFGKTYLLEYIRDKNVIEIKLLD